MYFFFLVQSLIQDRTLHELSCHFNLLKSKIIHYLYFLFYDPDVLKSTSLFLCRMYPYWVQLMFPHELIQIMHFWQEYQRSNTIPVTVYSIRMPMALICPITDIVNFNHLVKVMYMTFLYYQIKFSSM